MSIDYELAGWFPFTDPAAEAIRLVADVLGAPSGDSRIEWKGLVVYAVPPEDDELDQLRHYLGFDANLSLMFVPYGGEEQFMRAHGAMLRCAAALAIRGVRGLLFVDYGADASVILRMEDGRLTLNEAWEGWRQDPGLLAAVPEPYERERLTFAHHE
jgi:hypothetical protein